ncbi:MAG TPA: pyridoxal-dependent decarboxylase [Actinomycetota bacterium]|nr:pyridoxal-dependent decarboxylase [Actinomycetota bacterium]
MGDLCEDPGGYLAPAVEWVDHYLGGIRELPVAHQVAPGDITRALPEEAPALGEDLRAALEDLDRILLPGVTHWNHPRFFGYFGITGSLPGVAGELLAAALNSNAMLWRTGPAATELEGVATRWLSRLLGLPDWFGVIQDTASSATFTALAAARHRVDPEVRRRGLAGRPPMAVYCSELAHSSVDKAVLGLGIGTDQVRHIAADGAFRMDPAALEAAIEADVGTGVRPMAVVATVGTTAVTSVDPIPQIVDVCARHGLWLHIDGAYGAAAGAVPELRWVLEGASGADSLVVNPHKWLFVPVDCSVLYLADPEAARASLSVVPDYLAAPEDAPNLMDYGLPLGRRFRALKLWLVLRCLGTTGIRAALREHVRLAGLLAGWVEAEPGFDLAAPVPLSVVNFWPPPSYPGGAEALATAVNANGFYVTTARVHGRPALHVAVGNLGTTEDDVRALWALITQLVREPAVSPAGSVGAPGTSAGR